MAIKGFISYSTRERVIAGRVREALSHLGVDCFLAHDDIHVSRRWRDTILAELKRTSVFVPLLSSAFKASEWASQEIGAAVTRPRRLIIPISLDGTIPFGFIAHIQSERLPGNFDASFFAEAVASRHPREVIGVLLKRLAKAGGWRHAESLMKPLVPVLALFDQSEIDDFVETSIQNSEIWAASLCRREYIPAFIRQHRARIRQDRLKVLKYQIENDEWYPDISDAET